MARDTDVGAAKAMYDRATTERAALILEATKAGASRARIAEAIGRSVTRIQQIVDRERGGP